MYFATWCALSEIDTLRFLSVQTELQQYDYILLGDYKFQMWTALTLITSLFIKPLFSQMAS